MKTRKFLPQVIYLHLRN